MVVVIIIVMVFYINYYGSDNGNGNIYYSPNYYCIDNSDN